MQSASLVFYSQFLRTPSKPPNTSFLSLSLLFLSLSLVVVVVRGGVGRWGIYIYFFKVGLL